MTSPRQRRGSQARFSIACEQALWSWKERRKQRARTSEETGYARLAPLADLFSGFLPSAEPVHRLAFQLLIWLFLPKGAMEPE